MRLNRLFLLLGLLLSAAVVLMAAQFGRAQWRAYGAALQSMSAVDQLRLALTAAEMASRERGPMNGVLGDGVPADPARLQSLREARARTDAAFAALQDALDLDADPTWAEADESGAPGTALLRPVLHELSLARAGVDGVAARPREARSPGLLRNSVREMAAIVERLAPLISHLARRAQHAYPQLSDALQGARLSAELREQTGLLGSLLTPALTRQQAVSAQERLDIERQRGVIDALRRFLDIRVHAEADPATTALWANAKQRYFGEAAELVEAVIRRGEQGDGYDLDTAGFAARYVPPMNSILDLRDGQLAHARAEARQFLTAARVSLTATLVGIVVLIGLLAALLAALRRRVLAPLAAATRTLEALAKGRLDAELPRPRANDEMAAVIGALGNLKAEGLRRAEAERERDGLIAQLRDRSNTDYLTSVMNRRAFIEAAERELANARRYGQPLALVLLDVDHFKQLNDLHGHAMGDHVLVELAALLQRAVRQGDLLARFGGEEFVLLLRGVEDVQALHFADRIRGDVARLALRPPRAEGDPAPGSPGAASPAAIGITISLGVADTRNPGHGLDRLLARADAAMYRAKSEGRNGARLASRDDAVAEASGA